jgi:hypothetical protein
VHLLNKTVLPTWLPTFLHVRLTLFTNISPREADRMGYLFDGSLGGVWYPLGSLRKIDPDFRREALFRFANKIAEEHGWRRPFPMPEDQVGWAPPGGQGTRSTEHAQARQPPPPSTEAQVAAALRALGFQEAPSSFEPIKHAYRRKIPNSIPTNSPGKDRKLFKPWKKPRSGSMPPTPTWSVTLWRGEHETGQIPMIIQALAKSLVVRNR